MENGFLFAQVLGFFAMSFIVLAWQIKQSRKILLCTIPGSFLWGLQYILLGAPLGALTNFLSAAKDTTLLNIDTKHLPKLIAAFLLTTWVIGIYLFENWYDIIPIACVTMFNLALLQPNNRGLLARSSLTSNILWVIYNSIVGSWMGLLCAVLVIASTIIGMARHEGWQLGTCYRSFGPSLIRSLLTFPSWRTSP